MFKNIKEENPVKLEKQLLLDENRGIYIPKKFAENFDTKDWHLTKAQVKALKAGPDGEDYWEVWDEVLRDAHFHDENKVKWTLEQDGDLWAIPEGLYSEEDEEEEIEEEEKVHPGLHAEMKKDENPVSISDDPEDASIKMVSSLFKEIDNKVIELQNLTKLSKIKPRAKSRIEKKIKILDKARTLIYKASEIGQ